MRKLLKIGDFSQLAQVSTRTLRHYDQLGLLKPVQVDQFSDYRFYALDQLPRLNRILALKDLGLSLEQIAELIVQPVSANRLHALLDARQNQIEQGLREQQAQLMRVRARLRQIEREDQPTEIDVVLQPAEPMLVLAARRIVPSMREVLAHRRALYDQTYAWLAQHAIHPQPGNNAEMMMYHNDEYVEENVDIEAAVALDDDELEPTRLSELLSIRELPACASMATTVHHGTLFAARETLTALYIWIGENGYTSIGPCREVHLYGRECDLTDLSQPATMAFQVPVVTLTP
jgi:DNA-binding transcriptional MerR regulator